MKEIKAAPKTMPVKKVQPAPEPPAPPMRNARGVFVKGHKSVSPGRPPIRDINYKNAFFKNVPAQDWVAIIKQAVRQAKQGDKDARKWLTDYLVGPPVQRVAPTDPTGTNPYQTVTDAELVSLAKIVVAMHPADNKVHSKAP